MPARLSSRGPPMRTDGDELKSSRLDTKPLSWQSTPACRNTHRSSLTPSRRACSTEHMMRAADMSTSLLEFMYFGYGKPIIRLLGPGVRTSSGVSSRCTQAYGLWAATAENLAHISEIRTWCASTLSPHAARTADSNIGYTCTGMMT